MIIKMREKIMPRDDGLTLKNNTLKYKKMTLQSQSYLY